MTDSDDGAAAAAEAHFEALRRFVDERSVAARQQPHGEAHASAHISPIQVSVMTGALRHDWLMLLSQSSEQAGSNTAGMRETYCRCSGLQLAFAATGIEGLAHDISSGLQQPDTANAAFNKLAGVLAYLCAEVARLRRHVSGQRPLQSDRLETNLS